MSGDPDTVEMFEEWLTATLRELDKAREMRQRWMDSDFIGYLRANP